jgi:hypothetical protein
MFFATHIASHHEDLSSEVTHEPGRSIDKGEQILSVCGWPAWINFQ